MTVPRDAPAPGVMTLVLHHDYREGHARDLSCHGNHGAIVGAHHSGEAGLLFAGDNDRVVVSPSRSLARMRSVRVTASVKLNALPERSNLVEGFLSFALIVHGDGAVQGSMYDGTNWVAVHSGGGALEVGRWHEVTYLCASWLGSWLYVDGVPVGQDRRIPAMLQPVDWPFGLNVGAWPDADAFQLRGAVSQVWIWAEGQEPGRE